MVQVVFHSNQIAQRAFELGARVHELSPAWQEKVRRLWETHFRTLNDGTEEVQSKALDELEALIARGER